MKVYFLIFFFWLGCFTTIFSQKDSINVKSVLGLQEELLFRLYSKQAAALSVNPVQHYGIASLNYSQESGSYKRVQAPQKTAMGNFSSEGLKKVGNFWVQGSFIYQRQTDDSVQKSLRRNLNDNSPYYLWTPRTGDMNHEVYHLDGQFISSLFNNKLFLGAGAIYDASDNYRTIDPRPFINYFNFDVKASIGYKFNNHHLLVIEPHSGYSKETTSAYNKNNDSTNASNYQIYRAEGLTEISSASESKKQLNQWKNYTGISIGYYLSQTKLGNLMLQYAYQDSKEKNFNRFYNPTTELEYGRMSYYDHDVNINWNKKFKQIISSFGWKMNIQKSKDYNFYLNGVNYTSFIRSNNLFLGFSFLKNARIGHELIVEYNNQLREQKDGNGNARSLYKLNEFGVKYRFNHYVKHDLIQFTINSSMRLNNNGELQLPPSAFDYLFIPSIVYPDAEYYTTNSWQTGVKIAYNHLKASQLRYGISLGVNYQSKSADGLYFNNSYFHPGNSRTYFTACLHFFL